MGVKKLCLKLALVFWYISFLDLDDPEDPLPNIYESTKTKRSDVVETNFRSTSYQRTSLLAQRTPKLSVIEESSIINSKFTVPESPWVSKIQPSNLCPQSRRIRTSNPSKLEQLVPETPVLGAMQSPYIGSTHRVNSGFLVPETPNLMLYQNLKQWSKTTVAETPMLSKIN